MPSFEPGVITHWSTNSVPQAQRLDYWSASLTDALVPLGLDNADPRTFQSHMRLAAFGSVNVVRQRGSSHRAFREDSELKRSGEHSLNLLMALNCRWNATHGNRVHMLPGDVMLHDSRYPISIKIDSEYEFVNIAFPESWVRQWLPNPKPLVGCRITGSSPWGHALSSYLTALSPDLAADPPLLLSVMADQVGSLLALTAKALQNAHVAPARAARSLQDRIRDHIQQRCMEAELTAGEVAGALSISVRTLHRSFANANQTFGGYLIDARARVAIRMLASPLFKRVTTAEIGRRAGFLSASHFARVIRSRTGLSPLQVRRNAGSHCQGEPDNSDTLHQL